MNFFAKMSISTKIILTTFALVVAVVAINYVFFINGYRNDIEDSLMEKAASFTAVADEAKNHAGKLINIGAIDTETLVKEAVEQKEAGKPVAQTRFFNAIPVVVGWTTAQEAAKRENLEFKVAAFEARNPHNEPEKGSFRASLLKKLEDQVKAGGKEFVGEIDEKTNTLHYMRAIKLDGTCMMCHGDPAKYGPKNANGQPTGRDPLGYTMENWKEGYMHGAYEVSMPLSHMDAQVAGFFKGGMMWTVPVVVLSMGFFVWMLRGTISKPMSNMVGLFKQVATGDLTPRMENKRQDEMGTLATSFNAFMQSLQTLVKECSSSAQQVAAAANEIASSSEEMAQGMSRQQEQTNQVSAAVEEMSQTVVEVARKSAEASGAATDSGKNASGGGEVVAKTIEEMKQIAQQVTQSANAVGDLGKKSEQIGQIIAVINDIADQTNLLALNAAIEAARAGEHGRGFAVVADEVRKLAERTTTATEEVAKSIREIQAGTTGSVQIINASTERVSKGVDLANSAGTALEKIVASSKTLVAMVEQISTAAAQQSSASEQIAKNVEQINAVTRESTAGAQQAAQAAGQLSGQATQLASLVGKFKV